MKILYLFASLSFCFLFSSFNETQAQDHSIARIWNEEVLNGIRNDFARPTVHARNLWHTSVAMYDIWAIYDSIAEPYFMGNTINGYEFKFDGIPKSATPEADIHEAISYAMYTLMFDRFVRSPGAGVIFFRMNSLMIQNGYSLSFNSMNYQDGNPAALGIYIARQIIQFGNNDGSNQSLDYANLFYEPVNEPLEIFESGIQMLNDPNRWQPLTLELFIDQSGNVTGDNTPDFLGPEWGQVVPFALSDSDVNIYNRDGFDYRVYHDPGNPPYISLTENNEVSDQYKWGFSMVSIWSSHLDPASDVVLDISPASLGNVNELPLDASMYPDFYKFLEGGDLSTGHTVNPYTGLPYEPNVVKRADYARVLAEFWADGPDSETPPGHWFTLLNHVSDHPLFERKYLGKGEKLDALEWDVKSYMMLGGAMHDCAVAAWGIKGYYDYLRPISAIRSMGARGQCSDENLPNYHIGGIPLVDNYIELIGENDPLVGESMENLNKIKLYAWKGPDFIEDPEVDVAGVGWILSEDWFPYQRPSFVTPPFAGYVSGHSTYSRAAADLMSYMTGSEFFPGGIGEFSALKNEFLVFEEGPSEDVILQWATYRDASDQTSLSRIWGGIHPPADDIPGRIIGIQIAKDVIAKAESYMFKDEDQDGFYNYQDCNDLDAMINPSALETCDGLDNNCSGEIDENLPQLTYYFDFDQDGFGDLMSPMDTCLMTPPMGFVANSNDCNDNDTLINPDVAEICDAIDNNCDGRADEGLPRNRYYFDFDNDQFGDLSFFVDTCLAFAPIGFVANANDCNDNDNAINPNSPEVCDAIDNNCSGDADEGLAETRYYRDLDADTFGNPDVFVDTCISHPPVGFVANIFDCDDNNNDINPNVNEICDAIDNNCDGRADEGLAKNRYYLDFDGDGFGDENISIDTCNIVAPDGFVINSLDCNDEMANIHPDAVEIPDNGIDEDCTNVDLFEEAKVFPSPFNDMITIHLATTGVVSTYIYNSNGSLVFSSTDNVIDNNYKLGLGALASGIYFMIIVDGNDNELFKNTIVRI